MVKVPLQKIFKCQKVTCGHEWLQRTKGIKDETGRIIKVIANIPKNCSLCKSVNWEIKRY